MVLDTVTIAVYNILQCAPKATRTQAHGLFIMFIHVLGGSVEYCMLWNPILCIISTNTIIPETKLIDWLGKYPVSKYDPNSNFKQSTIVSEHF